MAQSPPAGFVEEKSQSGPPAGFVEEGTATTGEQPPNSVLGGAFRRGLDLLKSIPSQIVPNAPQDRPEAIANLYGPGGRAVLSGYRTAKEGIGQAKQQFQSANTSDPITNFLLRLRGVNTAVGSINPFSSGSVVNMNKLIDQGRMREAAGQGGLDAALQLLGLKRGPENIVEDVQRGVRNPTAPLRILGQELGGAGKEPVVKAARARELEVAKRQGAYEEKATNVSQANARVARIERTNQARTAYSREALDNAKQTQIAAKSALDFRWNNLRTQMDKPVIGKNGAIQTAPVAGPPIRQAIEQARTEHLVGSPEDLQAFDNLMGRLRDPSIASPEYAKPLTWNEARTHYANISDRLYSGNLPGNVYQALKLVKDSLDEQLGKAAQNRGLGAEYQSLKKDWSQYKSDFDDMSSVKTGGGSPLARLVRYPTVADAEDLLSGRYGEDVANRLSKYQNRGANPQPIAKIRELGKRVSAGERKPTPPPPKLPPEVNPFEIRRGKLEELSGRPASLWDLYPPRAVERLVLKSPRLRNFIARQPRKELKP